VRFAYNWCLRLRSDAYRNGKKIGYHESSALWTKLKRDPKFSWLNEVSCVPTQQALRHLQTAFANFFEKRSHYPCFKNKRGDQSAEYTTSAFTWDAANRNLTIAKVGRLRVRWSREFTSEPSTVTITKDRAGRYFMTLCLDEKFTKLPKTKASVGVDFGVSRLATLSNGERIPNPQHFRAAECRLAQAQRVLAHRKKGSGRWCRQRLKVARIHARIADARKDHLDKVTTTLVRRFGTICVEDLNLRGMVKNRHLAKSISDTGIGMAVRMLEYKADRYGRKFIKIDRFWPSSKTCSQCGYRLAQLDLGVREWDCPKCKAHHDRDENAAKNILAVGHTVTARGGAIRPVRASARKGKPRRSVNPPRKVC
jgi:putative transposase